MTKDKVASILSEIALLLELKGESSFKIRAYENAARALLQLDEDLAELVKENRLGSIKGIGKALEQKITELITTGQLKYYEELKSQFPPGLFDLLRIPGLGAKKVRALYETLGITSVGELEYACKENRLVGLPGFGQKTQENILKGIDYCRLSSDKHLLHEAGAAAYDIQSRLKECPEVQEVSIAGSLRRQKELIKDIDLLVASDEPDVVMDFFVSLPGVEHITGKGGTKASVRMKSGIGVDMRVVSKAQYPYALHHFTGSKEHNAKLRHIAKSLGFKLNEYGLWRLEDDSLVPCSSEAEIFARLGMTYIPPELREDMGEIESALNGSIPNLVKLSDLKGVMHVHTRYSDGSNTIAELVREAKQQGYSYLGISDHSRSAFYAGGLREDEIKRQHEEIDAFNEKDKDFYIFKGIESDILPDGSLDYEDRILDRFDFVIASVHSRFKMDACSMTKRILAALDNPYTTILGHPTGRLLLSRDGYSLDLDAILEKARERGVIIEINANPYRLDLDWRYVKKAMEMGIRLAVCPDAHSLSEISYMIFGVAMARKGWCEKDVIINCLEAEQLKVVLQRRKE